MTILKPRKTTWTKSRRRRTSSARLQTTERPTADDELFGDFCQDFEGWTEVMFRRVHATYTKELKRILRLKRVYTGRANMIPSEAVFRLLKSEDCPQWLDEQFQRTIFDERSVAYMMQQRLIQRQHVARSVQPADVGAVDRTQHRAPAMERDQEAEN